MKKIILIKYTLFFVSISFSQNKNINPTMYTSFDKTIGMLNTKLSYGATFEEKYRKIVKNNHNFFSSDLFQKGNIHYRGEIFFDVVMKYDIVRDIIIARITNQQEKISIVLEKDLVDRFLLNGSHFINTHIPSYGFLEEVAVSSNFSLLKKHKKVSVENTNLYLTHHTFNKRKDRYYLKYKKNFYPIESKRDFVKIFPEQKEKIKRFFKENSSLKKNYYKTFVINLLNQLQI